MSLDQKLRKYENFHENNWSDIDTFRVNKHYLIEAFDTVWKDWQESWQGEFEQLSWIWELLFFIKIHIWNKKTLWTSSYYSIF